MKLREPDPIRVYCNIVENIRREPATLTASHVALRYLSAEQRLRLSQGQGLAGAEIATLAAQAAIPEAELISLFQRYLNWFGNEYLPMLRGLAVKRVVDEHGDEHLLLRET